jgi:hypothetical protein
VLLFLDSEPRWSSREAGKEWEKYNAVTQSARRSAEKKREWESGETNLRWRVESGRKVGVKRYEGNLYRTPWAYRGSEG